MKTLLTTLTLVSLTTFTAFAATEENIHETRAAQAGGKLVVDVDFGSIDVTPGENDKVVIDAHRKIEASSKEKEEEYFKAVPITITTEGDRVIVRAIQKHESLGRQLWRMMGHTRTEGRYTIKVPANFNVDLDTSGGDVSANGLTGEVKVDTSGGDLNFGQIHGDIHADTSGGDITAKDCDGTDKLDTSGGRIEVTGGRGKLDVDTSGGNVTVLNRVGDTKVDSSGGKLRLGNISGKLNAETSGGSVSAILPSPVAGDVRLETSGGSITVLTPPNAALTIDAETSAGRVRSDLPISRRSGDSDSLKGTLNGGGTKLVLRSSAGSIDIVSADRETAAAMIRCGVEAGVSPARNADQRTTRSICGRHGRRYTTALPYERSSLCHPPAFQGTALYHRRRARARHRDRRQHRHLQRRQRGPPQAAPVSAAATARRLGLDRKPAADRDRVSIRSAIPISLISGAQNKSFANLAVYRLEESLSDRRRTRPRVCAPKKSRVISSTSSACDRCSVAPSSATRNRPGGGPTGLAVVLSHAFWQKHFKGDRSVDRQIGHARRPAFHRHRHHAGRTSLSRSTTTRPRSLSPSRSTRVSADGNKPQTEQRGNHSLQRHRPPEAGRHGGAGRRRTAHDRRRAREAISGLRTRNSVPAPRRCVKTWSAMSRAASTSSSARSAASS